MNKIKILSIVFLLFSSSSMAAHFSQKAVWHVCFTPGGECQQEIVNEITSAQLSVKVQAYELTSPTIIASLIEAQKRGVDIRVILDKSQIQQHHGHQSTAEYLLANRIPLWIDKKPAIAHNKVILIDENIVMTGSYNYSEQAQNRNAENLITIVDKNFYRVYLKNFQNRLRQSEKFGGK